MASFPHLKLPFTIAGASKPFKGFSKPSLQTLKNKKNRSQHGNALLSSVENTISEWEGLMKERERNGVEIPNKNDIPVFLKVDTEVFKLESLVNWGVQLISEENDGYVIGASTDRLEKFTSKIQEFIDERGQAKDKAAQVHNFESNSNWRLERLLDDQLRDSWSIINPDKIYIIEIGVSVNVINKNEYPDKGSFNSLDEFNESVTAFHDNQSLLDIERDQKQMDRESEVEMYIYNYNGVLLGEWDNGTDAVYFKIQINGKGLKDIVLTYQYLFEVGFSPDYYVDNFNVDFEEEFQVEVLTPNNTAASVCVIDSGIQENHKLIEPAIDLLYSKSYVDGDESVADFVQNSGHGTKVAGAILYPYVIPRKGVYQLESFIQNARILDSNNRISDNKFAPALIEEIVKDFPNTRIFNLSVSETKAYLGTHMPPLAASLDKLTHEKDILFVVAVGNIYLSSHVPTNPGIKELIASGLIYPDYLKEFSCKIANPSVSCFAIAVGSISANDYEDLDYKSLAGKNYISPFSRAGLGMWENMKPDVVEFGGDYNLHKINNSVVEHPELCPELINSTLYNANAVGKSVVGTSFSAPKVSYIASRLQSAFPSEKAQMYRALIIHSARLPEHCFQNPQYEDFCRYGYGIPNVDRALNNYAQRITFIQDGEISPKSADIYKIKIPKELRGEGKTFRILAEVTMAFTSKIRQTRKGAHSYLASWVEWKSSKFNENFNSFRNRTLSYIEKDESVQDHGSKAINWVIRENPLWGSGKINRNNSTVQKSWVVIEPHQFADEFSISIIGHSGWDKDISKKIPYALCVSFEILESEMPIYQLISEAQIETEIEEETEAETEIEEEQIRLTLE